MLGLYQDVSKIRELALNSISSVLDGPGADNGIDEGHMTMMGFNFSPGFLFFMLIFAVLGMILLFFIASLVYQHATRNGIANPLLWALLVILMPMLGLLLYLVVASLATSRPPVEASDMSTERPSSSTSVALTSINDEKTPVSSVSSTVDDIRFCPSCGQQVGVDDLFCTNCGRKLK